MNQFFSLIEEKFVPFFAKVGSQKHLAAVRDGFISLVPLAIAGSFAVLLNQLPIDAYKSFMGSVFGDSWTSFGGNIWWGTFAIISIFLSFTVSYFLAKSYNANGLSAGLISLSSFFILMPQVNPDGAWGNIHWGYTNAMGMFVAIIVALISTELFVKLSKADFLVIKMPEGVPPAVSRSFAALFPGMIVLAVASLVMILFTSFETNLFSVVVKYVAMPLTNVADSLGSALLIVFMTHFLWFFGLHGSNIIGGVVEPILLPLLTKNLELVEAGKSAFSSDLHVVTKPFLDAFVYLGGAGTTLALLIAILAVSKRKQLREVGKLGVAPGLFNINEPVIFGMPIVLNPVLFVPFILAPLVLTIVAYTAISLGLVPHTIAMIPWTTPPVIGGALATGSWQGGVLAAFNLVLAIVIYIPFIFIADRAELKKENA
ncbi:MAG: PTS sugar transporter subunit IIC [Firmicutes bacterium]|nr:PTS sugar transporter subunit IIC [Bacillota bacterium]